MKTPQTGDSKYGVITYSSSPTIFLRLKDFVSKEDLVERLRNIPWRGPGSDLDGALKKADGLFTNEGRLHARKVLVVYGDGPFSASVAELAGTREDLEYKHVKVITVTATDNEGDRKKLYEVDTTDEDSVIVDPQNPGDASRNINEKMLKGMQK